MPCSTCVRVRLLVVSVLPYAFICLWVLLTGVDLSPNPTPHPFHSILNVSSKITWSPPHALFSSVVLEQFVHLLHNTTPQESIDQIEWDYSAPTYIPQSGSPVGLFSCGNYTDPPPALPPSSTPHKKTKLNIYLKSTLYSRMYLSPSVQSPSKRGIRFVFTTNIPRSLNSTQLPQLPAHTSYVRI